MNNCKYCNKPLNKEDGYVKINGKYQSIKCSNCNNKYSEKKYKSMGIITIIMFVVIGFILACTSNKTNEFLITWILFIIIGIFVSSFFLIASSIIERLNVIANPPKKYDNEIKKEN